LLSALPLQSADASLPQVVIDPGHGGSQLGAVGVCGVREKDVALAVGLKVSALLRASGRALAILTREGDEELELRSRPRLANEVAADLFVSIHANAGTDARARGIETFFLAARSSDHRAQMLASRENAGGSVQAPQASDPLTTILQDLSLNAAHHRSQRLAMQVQQTLTSTLGGIDRKVQQAPFAVLTGARMPAVLVEIGFLSNPEECKKLRREDYRDSVARGITAALLTHIAGQRRISGPQLGQR